MTPGARRGLALATALGALTAIGIVSVALAPDAEAPQAPAASRRHSAAPGPPACTRAAAASLPAAFPVDARIRGGPRTYRGGDDFRYWTIELTSHASAVCGHLHPVLVLVDRTHALRPDQVRLALHDGAGWRPAPVVHTDRDENIAPGPFGVTLRPGRTHRIRVRLAFTAEARADDMAVLATVVQRRGDDGDWVGESGWYAFSVADGRG